jgi:hypothetical protein
MKNVFVKFRLSVSRSYVIRTLPSSATPTHVGLNFNQNLII